MMMRKKNIMVFLLGGLQPVALKYYLFRTLSYDTLIRKERLFLLHKNSPLV